jgi:hypothetical protein
LQCSEEVVLFLKNLLVLQGFIEVLFYINNNETDCGHLWYPQCCAAYFACNDSLITPITLGEKYFHSGLKEENTHTQHGQMPCY